MWPNQSEKVKQKAARLAAALRSSDPVEQTVPSWEGKAKKRPPLRYDQCARCKETGHWRNECPHRRGTSKGSKKFSQPNKERYQPEQAVQNLISLAGADRLGKTGLPDPWPPGAHGHDESRGPINDFYGAEHSMVTTPGAPLTGQTAPIVGTTWDMAPCSFCKACLCQLGGESGDS